MKEEPFDEYLIVYDSLQKDGFVSNRLAYKPLYEFFQRIVSFVGIQLCNLPETYKNQLLNTVWINVKPCLFQIDQKIEEWENLIKEIHNLRTTVEHNFVFGVDINTLTKIREKAPDFRKWIIITAKEYFKKSKSFTMKETLYNQISYYIRETEIILEEYGKDGQLVLNLIEEEKIQLPELLFRINSIKNELNELHDINSQDLLDFIKILQFVIKFRTKEESLLSTSICPKCGGFIKETQKTIYSGYGEDAEPQAIAYRVGCLKCDYTINEDTIDI